MSTPKPPLTPPPPPAASLLQAAAAAASSSSPTADPVRPPQRPWDLAKRYGRSAFYAFFAVSVGSSLYQQWRSWKELVTLPTAFFLELDLEQNTLVERSSNNPLSLLRAAAGKEIELHRLIHVLQLAKADERVKGLFTLIGDRANFGGMAQLQELRNALLDFRFHAQGRAPVYAYSNSFCEGGSNGTGLYYLASAADKVFMPPTGMLSLLGFASSQVFVKGLLDRFKVQPEVFRREQYKSALAPLTGTGYDQPHRDNITALLGSLYQQVVQGIASARRLKPAAVEAAINSSPLLASQAMQLKLLDGLAYRDQVESLLLQLLPADVQKAHEQPLQPPKGVPLAVALRSKQLTGPRVSLQRYSLAQQWSKSLQQFWSGGQRTSSPASSSSLQQGPSSTNATAGSPEGTTAGGSADSQQAAAAPSAPSAGSVPVSQQPVLPQDKPIVAVVTAAGAIMQTNSAGPEAGGQSVVESHKLVRVLRGYRDNPQVKAVVLRINSPGGSAVASDMIAREVQLLKEAGKPVVACMGDVAASGGYYIAAPCNKILAQPGTITGSIGVIFMKLNVKDALEEYGVTGDAVSFGDNADWTSGLHSLTPKQQQQVEGFIGATYDDFLAVVAKGRSMTKDAVREVAKGRVWTGSQAMEIGLVDEVGGLVRATDLAKQLAGLPMGPDDTITQDWPPSRVPPIVKLLQAASGADGTPVEASAAAAVVAAGGGSDAGGWLSASSVVAQVSQARQLSSRAAAAAELMSLFWHEALLPAWCGMLPQQWQQQLLRPVASAVSGQQLQQLSLQAHPAVAAARAGGMQLQLMSVLSYLAQQHNQPEMYCMESELLSRSC